MQVRRTDSDIKHRTDPHVADAKQIVIAFSATFIGVKIVTSAMILYVYPSWTAFWIIMGLSALWFAPLVIFGPSYVKRRYRLWLVRLRRKRLLREEWNVD